MQGNRMALELIGEDPQAFGRDACIVARVVERLVRDLAIGIQRGLAVARLQRLGDALERAALISQRPVERAHIEGASVRANVEDGGVRVEALDNEWMT